MSMMQVAAVGVAGALLSICFKTEKTEYGILVGIGISILLFSCILGKVGMLFDTIREIQSMLQIDGSYLTVLLKMIGIAYVGEFAAGICRDTGHQTIAAQVELFGKLSILVLSLPVLTALLQTIQGFLS